MPRLVLDPGQVTAVVAGRRLSTVDLEIPDIPTGAVALLDPEGRLVALGDVDPVGGWVQPRKVLGGQ
jgi:hypothetical protein